MIQGCGSSGEQGELRAGRAGRRICAGQVVARGHVAHRVAWDEALRAGMVSVVFVYTTCNLDRVQRHVSVRRWECSRLRVGRRAVHDGGRGWSRDGYNVWVRARRPRPYDLEGVGQATTSGKVRVLCHVNGRRTLELSVREALGNGTRCAAGRSRAAIAKKESASSWPTRQSQFNWSGGEGATSEALRLPPADTWRFLATLRVLAVPNPCGLLPRDPDLRGVRLTKIWKRWDGGWEEGGSRLLGRGLSLGWGMGKDRV